MHQILSRRRAPRRLSQACTLLLALYMSISEVSAERPEPRAEMSPPQRAEHFTRLRKLYAGPPASWPAPTVDESVDWRELGKLPEMTHPSDNPSTREKVKLGKQMFFDPRLSGSGQIACASCHDPDLGWGDGRTVSFGHNREPLTRNAPTVLNSGYRKSLFWDGRAGSLEEQATQVVNNPSEMHSSAGVVVEHLSKIPAYVDRFEEVFGPGELTMENAIRAIAAYERTLVGGRSRFDYFLNGRSKALTDEALSGLHLFRTDARCMNCHHGPLMTDEKFHNLGISHYGRRFEDLGRYNVTKQPQHVGAFRTPSLRNVMNNGPYMHHGMFSLDELLTLYNSGMPNPRRRKDQKDDPLFPQKSQLLKVLHLNQRDIDDLKAFFVSLSEPHFRVEPPALPGL